MSILFLILSFGLQVHAYADNGDKQHAEIYVGSLEKLRWSYMEDSSTIESELLGALDEEVPTFDKDDYRESVLSLSEVGTGNSRENKKKIGRLVSYLFIHSELDRREILAKFNRYISVGNQLRDVSEVLKGLRVEMRVAAVSLAKPPSAEMNVAFHELLDLTAKTDVEAIHARQVFGQSVYEKIINDAITKLNKKGINPEQIKAFVEARETIENSLRGGKISRNVFRKTDKEKLSSKRRRNGNKYFANPASKSARVVQAKNQATKH